jgi:hypothetical protein
LLSPLSPVYRALACLLSCLGCGVLGPPGGDAQYPAVRVPTHAARASNPAPGSAGAQPREPGSNPAPGVRLLRPNFTPERGEALPESASAPEHGYLPDPPALSARARWLYEVRYDAGVISTAPPGLECLARPSASARRMGRFAFELWLGAELIERIRFDFPLLAGEEPRRGPRRPLREEPRFAPGAHVSVRLQVPASPRATRAQLLDRATGETTAVPWPPRAEPEEKLCPASAGAPTPAAARAIP